MKQLKVLLFVGVAVLGTGVAGFRAQAEELTRSQWLKSIGASVKDLAALTETLSGVPAVDKVEFTQKLMKATARLPVEPAEKGAALVRNAVGVISSSSGEIKQEVIAEVFAGVQIEHLPLVTEELAKRFDQEVNQLTNEQFEQIATDTLNFAVQRNAKADMPSVRNTFVALAFLHGSKDATLKNKLISLLPDERQRNLAAAWIPPALEHNYEPMLVASDVEPVEMRQDLLLPLVGRSNLDRLLADLTANLSEKPQVLEIEGAETTVNQTVWVPLSEVRASGGVIGAGLSAHESTHPGDFGINRVPRSVIERCPCGYQGQGTRIRSEIPSPKRR